MKFTRAALLLAFLAAPLALAGCGSDPDAPSLVGKEEIEKLPKDENFKPSAKAKRLKASSPVSGVQLQQ